MFRYASLRGTSCWLAKVRRSHIQIASLIPIPQRFLLIPIHYREGFRAELGTDAYRGCHGAECLVFDREHSLLCVFREKKN